MTKGNDIKPIENVIDGTDIINTEVQEVNPIETPTVKKTEYKAIALLNIKFNGKAYKTGEEFIVPKNKVDQLEGFATIEEVAK